MQDWDPYICDVLPAAELVRLKVIYPSNFGCVLCTEEEAHTCIIDAKFGRGVAPGMEPAHDPDGSFIKDAMRFG